MATPDALRLVIGDEELLVARGVAAAVAAARAADPGRGGRRSTRPARHDRRRLPGRGQPVAVRRPAGGRGARRAGRQKDLAAALLAYAAGPEPDVMLVVTHAGGAKGKALADGLREAGAPVDQRRPDQAPPRPGRLRPRRVAPAGRQVQRGRRRGAARRGRQRPARPLGGLLAAGRRHRRPDRPGHRRPLLPGPGRGQRLHRRRRRHRRRPARRAGGAAVGAARRRRPGADRRRARRRRADGRRGWPRPAGATPTSSPARSACRRGRSSGRSGRPGAGPPRRSRPRRRSRRTATPRSRVARRTATTRWSRPCSRWSRPGERRAA